MEYQEIENNLIDFTHKKEGKDYPIHDVSIGTAVDFIMTLANSSNDIQNVSDNDIDELLRNIDQDARDYDSYGSGLPIDFKDDDTEQKILRATVRTWLSGR